MTISKKLNEFYINNKLSINGGENDETFKLNFKFFHITLPNTEARKKVLYIHDIQHVLFDCDISWKGESYIAGWEIATGMYKLFPVGILSLWAMGFGLLTHPKEVLKGYQKGLHHYSLTDLNISKEVILEMPEHKLKKAIEKEKPTPFYSIVFGFWSLIAISSFLIPFTPILILLFLFL